MPVPASLLEVASLPYTRTVTMAEFNAGTYGNAANEVWFHYLATSNDYLGTVFGFPSGATMRAYVYHTATLTQLIGGNTGSEYTPLVSGDDYYIKIVKAVAGAIAADFDVSLSTETADPDLTVPYFVINDDSYHWQDGTSTLPSAVYDATTGALRGFKDAIPGGEIGQALSDGHSIWVDRYGRYGDAQSLVIFDAAQTLVVGNIQLGTAMVDFPCVTTDGTQWYVWHPVTYAVHTIQVDGTTAATPVTLDPSAFGAQVVHAMAISSDQTTIYWVINTFTPAIKATRLSDGVALSDFYTVPVPGGHTYRLAATANNNPGDMLVLPDGSLVTWWSDITAFEDYLIHLDAAGTLLTTYTLDRHTERMDHLATLGGSASILLWTFYEVLSEGTGRLAEFTLATQTEVWGVDVDLFAQGENLNNAPSTNPFGPSNSCTLVPVLAGVVPPAPLAGLTVEVFPRRWLRRSPHLTSENKRMFYGAIELAMNVGNGLTTGQGSDPQVMMRWSNDGGHTWSNEHWKSSGPKGQYRRRVRWGPTGAGRDRVFEFSGSDPVPVALVEGYLDVEEGTS